MKKYLLLAILLVSCESRDEILDRQSRKTLSSAFQTLQSTVSIHQYWDSTLSTLVLTKEEKEDTNYKKLNLDYEISKHRIISLDTEKIKSRYENIHKVDPDQGLEFASNFDIEAVDLQMENLKTYFLLYKQKESLIEERKK